MVKELIADFFTWFFSRKMANEYPQSRFESKPAAGRDAQKVKIHKQDDTKSNAS